SQGPVKAPESAEPLDVPLEPPLPELVPESDPPELLPLEPLLEVDPPPEAVLPHPLPPELAAPPLDAVGAPELAELFVPELASSPGYELDVSFELHPPKSSVDEQTATRMRTSRTGSCSMPSGSDDGSALPSEKLRVGNLGREADSHVVHVDRERRGR